MNKFPNLIKLYLNLLGTIRQAKSIYIIIIISLGAVFFNPIILHPDRMLYPSADIVNIYSIWRKFLVESIIQFKEIPLWIPSVFSGAPFIGNTQSGIFYPFTLFFFLIPIHLAFGYLFILDFILIGIFTYIYARSIKLGNFSSLVSAVTLMFSGVLTTRLIPGHLFILDTFTWFPLLLFLLEKIFQTKKIIYGILCGCVVAIMYFAGNVQMAYYGVLSAFLYSLVYYVTFSIIRKRLLPNYLRILIPLLSVVIGVLLISIQLLPSIEFSAVSARSQGLPYEVASSFSIHPKQLILFILPHFFGGIDTSYWGKGNFWETSGYIGILPLILALIGIIYKRNRYTITFLVLLLFSLFLSLGRSSPLFFLFYNLVPGFNLFRAPARFLFIYAFSASLLAGFGVECLVRNKQTVQLPFKRIGTVLAVLSCVIFLLWVFITFNSKLFISNILEPLAKKYYILNPTLALSYIQNDIFLLSLLTLFSGFLFLCVTPKSFTKAYFKVFLFLLILFDLWYFAFQFLDTKSTSSVYNSPTFTHVFDRDRERFRVFNMSPLPFSSLEREENITGYDAIYLSYYRDYVWYSGKHLKDKYEPFITLYTIDNLRYLQLLNVKYIITQGGLRLNVASLIYKGPYSLYKLNEFFPRAYIIPNAIIIRQKDKTLALLGKENFNLKKYVILEKDPHVPLKNPSVFQPVEISHYEPNKIVLKTTRTDPGFLVLSEIWYPGWKAYDNGKEVPVLKANSIFRSVYLSRGKHEISFIFKPFSYMIGALISLFMGTVIFFYFVFIFFFHKR